jgi:GTP-binding protein
MKKFSKNKNSEVLTLSTLDKESISKIKAKLLSYVS